MSVVLAELLRAEVLHLTANDLKFSSFKITMISPARDLVTDLKA